MQGSTDLITREGRYMSCAAQGTSNRVPYAPRLLSSRRPLKSLAWSAHTKCPFIVRLPTPYPIRPPRPTPGAQRPTVPLPLPTQ